jgi:hypothetical protein
MGEAAKIGSFSQDYVLRNFPKTIIENNRVHHVIKYDEEVFGYTATDEEYNMLGSIGGVENLIDMSTELAASAAILNIRSVEPQDALKIYTEIAMENAVNSFLGTTGTTHTEVLSRLKAKYNFTDRQIHEAIENTVCSALTNEMSKGRNGYVPIEIYNEWNRRGYGDFIGTATDVLVAFFENPTQRNYEMVRGMMARQAYLLGQGDILAFNGSADALMNAIKYINLDFGNKIDIELTSISRAATFAKTPNDQRLNVFSIPYAATQRGERKGD